MNRPRQRGQLYEEWGQSIDAARSNGDRAPGCRGRALQRGWKRFPTAESVFQEGFTAPCIRTSAGRKPTEARRQLRKRYREIYDQEPFRHGYDGDSPAQQSAANSTRRPAGSRPGRSDIPEAPESAGRLIGWIRGVRRRPRTVLSFLDLTIHGVPM